MKKKKISPLSNGSKQWPIGLAVERRLLSGQI
jgi:hypothetical protein